LASDPDREGEAIAWHLVAALGLKSPSAIRRISFHEITRDAILKAVQQPRAIDGTSWMPSRPGGFRIA
jgi:DNA topoisomerase I